LARRYYQVLDEQPFTASFADQLVPYSPYCDAIDVSLRSTVSTAAVVTANLLAQIQPFEVKLNNTAVISIRGEDILALDQLYLGELPIIGETTAVGPAGKVQGLTLPVWTQPKHGNLSIRPNFVSQTNLTVGVMSVEAELLDKVLHDGYLSYLTSFYSPVSTGAFNLAYDSPLIGDLQGLLIFSTTIPTYAADIISAREIQLFVDGILAWQVEWKNLTTPAFPGAQPAPPPVGTTFGQGWTNFLNKYGFYDTSEDPIPKGKRLTIRINSDDTNNIRIIPIQQVKP
jgi:hypothetical protein